MRPCLPLFALLIPVAACRTGAPHRAPAADPGSAMSSPPAPAEPWTVRLDGLGPLTFGMSLAQARAALGDSLAVTPPTATCGFAVPREAPAGLRLMVEQGKVVRVDVDSGGIRTEAGAEVGMGEADVRSRYPGLSAQPHKYDSTGRYLIVQDHDGADSARRLIFETDAGRVARYRAGIMPAVEYVEGCG